MVCRPSQQGEKKQTWTYGGFRQSKGNVWIETKKWKETKGHKKGGKEKKKAGNQETRGESKTTQKTWGENEATLVGVKENRPRILSPLNLRQK